MIPSTFYHLYNRANGNENLFRVADNYNYFLRKYAHHINPIADTYAYCLLPNHFHLLIKIKEEELLLEYYKEKGKLSPTKESYNSDLLTETLISQPFSNLFNAYTKAYNNSYNRKGSLFCPNFKKKEITTDIYLSNVIHYIHANPVNHGFTKFPHEWPHSSYQSLLLDKPTALRREEVIQWFGDKNDFVEFHKRPIDRLVAIDIDI